MTDQALLPCPFCGNEAIMWPVVRPTCFQVGCKRCGGRSDGYPVASEAVAAWNTRPTPAERPAEDAATSAIIAEAYKTYGLTFDVPMARTLARAVLTAERPVPQEDRCPTCERTATEFRGYQPERCRDPWHKTAHPVPQVREAKTHHLKTWPEYFSEVLAGRKSFEWRIDDRDFKVGDTLVLQEYIPHPENPGREGQYTGREITKIVSYMFSPWPTNKRTVVMALTARPSDAAVARKIAQAICCPKGCVRDDDCLSGERREQREIAEAVMALFALPPEEPARVTPSTEETPWVCACCGTRGVTDGKSSRVTEPQPPSTVGGEALRQIVARTYSTDRRCRLDYEAVAEIYDIASAALSPTIASEKECGKAVWSVRKTPEPVIDDDYPAENYYDVLCPDGAWRGAVAVSADDARETIQEEWKNEHPAPPAASLIAKEEMPLPALQPSKE